MAKTHYQVLGVKPGATASEIKAAHRRLVMRHHPDRATSEASLDIFLEVQAAYEVIGDPDRRTEYDNTLNRSLRHREEDERRATERAQTRKAATPPTETSKSRSVGADVPVAAEIMRLSRIFSQGRQAEAIDLARQIIERDPRQPLPYAVLADIARGRGDLNQASKWYAYAVQFDPKNEAYQKRYEELLLGSQVVSTKVGERMYAPATSTSALAAAIVLSIGLATLTMFVKGPESLPVNGILAFCSGTFLGGALAIGCWIDRLSVTLRSYGLVVMVAGLNLGLGLVFYLLYGLVTKSFNRSFSGWLGAMIPGWILFALLGLAGGSLPQALVLTVIPCALAIGGLCGWAIGDALR
jgi:hypothetical protein